MPDPNFKPAPRTANKERKKGSPESGKTLENVVRRPANLAANLNIIGERRSSQESPGKKEWRCKTATNAQKRPKGRKLTGAGATIAVPEPTASPLGARFRDEYDKPFAKDFVIRRKAKVYTEMRAKPFCQRFYLPEKGTSPSEASRARSKAETAMSDLAQRQQGPINRLKFGIDSESKYRTMHSPGSAAARKPPAGLPQRLLSAVSDSERQMRGDIRWHRARI